MDVEKFVRHLCRLVLRHQMPVWNYFVNSFYSVCYVTEIEGYRTVPIYSWNGMVGQRFFFICNEITRKNHILRDRRPITTACPASWAMGTYELK
jgi:hypothetical protein